MTDLPEEIDHVPTRKSLGNTLSRVFGGAHLVGFHFDKGLVCVWYGGSGFNVYDPRQWFGAPGVASDQPNGDTGEIYHFNVGSCMDNGERSFEKRLNAAKVTMAEYGFDYVDPGGNALEVEE